jgi:lysophospholipase L1-like esterase
MLRVEPAAQRAPIRIPSGCGSGESPARSATRDSQGARTPAAATFAEVVDRLLPDARTVNLGVPGYTSFQGYKLLLTHEFDISPDVVVVSFNYNDRRYVLSSDAVDGDERFRRIYAVQRGQSRRVAVAPFLEFVYLYRLTRFLVRALGFVEPSGSDRGPTAGTVRLDTLHPRVDLESYRYNLVRMVQLARQYGAAPVFLILKDNPVQTEYLTKGVGFLEDSLYEPAIESLRVAAQLKNTFSSLARIYLARAYRARGLSTLADSVLQSKAVLSLHGGAPVQLDSEYNRVMNEVAAEYGVDIVDAGRVLDEAPAHYFDFCHFDAPGHEKVGTLLAERIAEVLVRR